MTQGERVKEIRQKFNLTLETFGQKLGVQRAAISKIERGENSLSKQMLKSICREFNINEEWLKNGTGEMFIPLTKEKQISTFINNALKDEPASFRRRLISALMILKEDDWVKLGEVMDNLQIGILEQEEANSQSAPQKTLEEMSLGELNIEAKKEEIEYIKSSSNSAGKTTSFVSNTTADTQKKSKNINTNDKVSNQ